MLQNFTEIIEFTEINIDYNLNWSDIDWCICYCVKVNGRRDDPKDDFFLNLNVKTSSLIDTIRTA